MEKSPQNGQDTPAEQTGKSRPAALVELRQALRSIHKGHWRYMLLFALAPIFPGVKLTMPAGSGSIFGMHPVFATGIAFSLGAAFGLLPIRLKWLHRWARALAGLLAVLFAAYMAPAAWLPIPYPMLWFGLVFGMCAAVSLFGFTYALPPFAQFLGVLLTAMFSMLAQMVFSLPLMRHVSGTYYLVAQVAVTAVCLLRYRPQDYLERASAMPATGARPLALSGLFFLFHRSAVFFYSYLNHLGARMDVAFFGMAVIVLTLMTYFMLRVRIWHLCNLFFAGMIAAYGMRMLFPGPTGILTGDFFHSFSIMGFIAAYYLVGQAFSLHGGYRVFRRALAMLFTLSLLPHVIPSLIANTNPESLPVVGVGVTTVLLIVFMLMSPMFSRMLQDIDPLEHPEGPLQLPAQPAGADGAPQSAEDRARLMDARGLTTREKEVAELLFHGFLHKECADKLGISSETVKFHSRNLYRKLDIAGRNELAAFFNQASAAPAQPEEDPPA